jgi:hypothetical protein
LKRAACISSSSFPVNLFQGDAAFDLTDIASSKRSITLSWS